jgi:ATP-binding cassette subfamily B protein
VDFEVPSGGQVALVGPSGIGKSTLVSLLLRMYDPTGGRVLIDGQDVRSFTLASLRSQVSVVLQDGLLFAASVRDNIAYASSGATAEEVEAAARLANAHDFIRALPEGYDTVLGERGVTLSHGQRQRLAIARAAVRRAPLLVLDEPTTGLDEENERAVVEALRRLAAGRTTFLVTHDLRLASRSDLILYLDRGGVAERGTHAELLDLGGRYAALYRMQSATDRHTAREEAHALAR